MVYFHFACALVELLHRHATNNDELVVNGWSPSKRNNPYANSGLVVQVEIEDVIKYNWAMKQWATNKDSPLLMMEFQKELSKKLLMQVVEILLHLHNEWLILLKINISSTLPKCSYIPGIQSASLKEVLPDFIQQQVKKSIKIICKKNACKKWKQWLLY